MHTLDLAFANALMRLGGGGARGRCLPRRMHLLAVRQKLHFQIIPQ